MSFALVTDLLVPTTLVMAEAVEFLLADAETRVDGEKIDQVKALQNRLADVRQQANARIGQMQSEQDLLKD